MQLNMRTLLKYMNDNDASDIYITGGLQPCFRINGHAKKMEGSEILTKEDTQNFLFEVISDKKKDEFLENSELNSSVYYEDLGRFRLNAYVQRGAVSMVIRKITTEIPTLEQLKLPEVFKDIISAKNGLIIMVGSTGSGKSTSLAAMVNHLNEEREGHIITIEDPVEYVHEHKNCVVSQREVGSDTESWENALKNTLRQAPDIILVGEIRERETMEHALNFSETGHLCMSTLHANNANQAIDRIINMFPQESHDQIRMNLSLNLKALISQRLVKTIDGKRVACIEILVNNSRIADLIMSGETGEIKTAMELGGNYGMQTFDMHLVDLVKQGKIDENTAIMNADSRNDVKLKLKMEKLSNNIESDEGEGGGGEEKKKPKFELH